MIKLLLNTVGFLGFGPPLDRVFTVNLMSVAVCGFSHIWFAPWFSFLLIWFRVPLNNYAAQLRERAETVG